MMMKKTTSALAVAALLGTGAASAATFQVDENTSMNIYVGIYADYFVQTDKDGNETTSFDDNGSEIIFSGERTSDSGLTTFFNLDLDGLETTDANSSFEGSNGQGGDLDEASVGIRGDFGEIVVGSNGGVYDEYADFADGGSLGATNITSFSGGDKSDVIQYGNSAGNLSYKLQAQVGDDAGETSDNTSTTSLGAGADLDLGGAILSAAYEQRANTATDEPIYGVGASTNLGGASVTVGYEVDDRTTNGVDKVSLAASYPVGAVTLMGYAQNVSFDSTPSAGQDTLSDQAQDDDSFTEVMLAASYGITSQMTVGIEMTSTDRKNDEGDYTGVGLLYSF